MTLNDFIEKIWFKFKSNTSSIPKTEFFYKNFGTGETVTSESEIPLDKYGIVYVSNKHLDNNFYSVATFENDKDDNLVALFGEIKLNALIKGSQKRMFENCSSITYKPDKTVVIEGNIPNFIHFWFNTDKISIAAKKTFGSKYAILGGNNFCELNSLPNVNQFVKYKETLKKPGKTQDLIDELVKLTPPIGIEEAKPEGKAKYTYSSSSKKQTGKTYLMVSKIIGYKEPCVCIRSFVSDMTGDCVCEGSRIYIMKKQVVFTKKNNFGDFVIAPAQSPQYWNHSMLELEHNVCKGTLLSYFNNIANEINENTRMHMVMACIKMPVIEKLYKAGYKNIVNIFLNACTSYYSRYTQVADNILGNINPKEKNLYKSLGINKHQLEKFNTYFGEKLKKDKKRQFFDYSVNVISIMKEHFPDINSYDDSLFDKLFALFTMEDDDNFYGAPYHIGEILNRYISLYSMESFVAKYDVISNFLKSSNSVNVERVNGRGITFPMSMRTKGLMEDYLRIVELLNDPAHFRFDFKTSQELANAHDLIAEFYNTKQNEIIMDRFVESVDKLNKYKYEKGDYTIVIPSIPEDLAYEGITLHHCVKSYTTRVATGATGIVFLRKKEDPTTPFFTVEIQNNTIMQIHGMCNCNVTDNNMKSFVEDWAKAKKLAFNPSGINIVR